ncbi:MAG: pilus assembly protein PilP [Magnetococcus sp. DMHC-8]
MKGRTLFLIGMLLGGTDLLANPVPSAPGAAGTEPFVYRAQDRRNPFQAPVAVLPDESTGPGPRQQTRIKEYLESFQLDSLKLVAILFDVTSRSPAHLQGSPVAMVEDPDGTGHVVREGSYIGVNEGRVARIRDGEVVIEEPAPRPNDPPYTMTLQLHKTEEPGRDHGPAKTKK